MLPLIITICTSNKRILPVADLCASNLSVGSQQHVASTWLSNLSCPREVFQADTLYCGRGFAEALKAAQSVKADLWIISAGLGLIHSKEKIPSYNLTISANSANIRQKVRDSFDYAKWWSAINNTKQSLVELISTNPNSTVFLILNQSYAILIRDDLMGFSEELIARLRIFGITKTDILSEKLRDACMPYDIRINDPVNGIPGTWSDFGQRTLRHFVTQIWHDNQSSSAKEHAGAVIASLSAMEKPIIPSRRRMSDETIKEIMLKHLSMINGSASKMLRILRDEENIACEQKRCQYIMQKLKEEVTHVGSRQRVSHTQSA